jgi:hypothetical protein
MSISPPVLQSPAGTARIPAGRSRHVASLQLFARAHGRGSDHSLWTRLHLRMRSKDKKDKRISEISCRFRDHGSCASRSPRLCRLPIWGFYVNYGPNPPRNPVRGGIVTLIAEREYGDFATSSDRRMFSRNFSSRRVLLNQSSLSVSVSRFRVSMRSFVPSAQ